MKYSYTIAFFALSLIRAQECSLKGVAVSDTGSPVAGVEVSISGGGFRHTNPPRSMKTGEDGAFSFTGLACGKYMVIAYNSDISAGFQGPLMVDVKKQPVIQLKIPNVDPVGNMLYVAPEKEPKPVPDLPKLPGIVATTSEDPAISLLRRRYFEQLNPAQLTAFDAAPLAQKKRMYAMALTVRMVGGTDPDPTQVQQPPEKKQQRRSILGGLGRMSGVGGIGAAAAPPTPHLEEDQAARRMLTQAASIVRDHLSPEEVAAFAQAAEIERARIFLRAVTLLPARREPGCGMYGVMVTDMESGGGRSIGHMIDRVIDDPTAGRWDDLDTLGRCALIDRTAVKELELAKSLGSDGSVENLKNVAARMGITERGPRTTVLDVFGNDGLKHYEQARGVDQKLEVFRAAVLMNLCWGVVYTEM
jgi:hypothetical protein